MVMTTVLGIIFMKFCWICIEWFFCDIHGVKVVLQKRIYPFVKYSFRFISLAFTNEFVGESLQWNLYKTDNIGVKIIVRHNKMSAI